ncbi:hypothetical protein CRG98_032681 [Punica granatum]|uniref:3-beta hydroxysteroid dehydrogenase/isomerase domain-containing protein n=1 Tax=Punica granatum TaxID=22663 RepID=A0A2I0ITB3_PUNGR|nr:hypothetical protein CRG98_032681 [Punica granatum]
MAPAMIDPPSNTVCVMDASGGLGSGLSRSMISDPSVDKRKLKIFSSDPFDYQSIIDALKGCSGLFYTFEPPEDQPNYDEYMAEVEVRAAHNVLEACAQTDTIDKVIFTSSVTAVIWRDDHASSDTDFNETHWSNVNLCRKFKVWMDID